jgi:hypothetical protein
MFGQVRQLALLAALAAACGEQARKQAPVAQDGPAFRVDTVAPAGPCARGASCALTIRLEALGGFHINKDYPHKFVPDPEGGIVLEDPGRLRSDDQQSGTLTIRFKADAGPARPIRVAGKLRFSVCSEESCRIEAVPVAADVPVS